MTYLLRRRKLGRGSCKAISQYSTKGIETVLHGQRQPPEGMCIRWGCTANVPTKDIVNEAKAIHVVADKTGFREILEKNKLCPRTWFAGDDVTGWPVIVRPRNHHQGRHFYVCKDDLELGAAFRRVGVDGYASILIDKSAEYRVLCSMGRVVWVARKFHPDPKAVAWNVAQGGKFVNVKWDEWPLEVCAIALKAHALSGLDFSGVDVIVDKGNKPYVLELNAAPSLTSPYRQQCMAKLFDYMIDEGRKPLPLGKKAGWRKYIHPAIWPRNR